MTDSTSRGLTWGKASANKRQSSKFKTSLAVVIGIDRYSNGIPPLSTAVNDATKLAEILKEEHGYEVTLLIDEDVTVSRLETVFGEEFLKQKKISKDDRLLVYFAGHGVASDGENGPEGFLIPQDARREDSSTFWPMTELHKALEVLPCRHMLAILDCCFAGAFRWSSKRDFQPLPPIVYKERYDRFIRDAAWQVITSASYDQKALDILSGSMRGEQGARKRQQHSPFALALFDALDGAADTRPKNGDGVITATELYLYLRDEVEVPAEELAAHRQTPGLWPLNRHEHGEFIFLVPGHELNLPPA
ncbi:MAG: caspase family protein, partial [Candidatus Electrothrix sp. AR1]|nr:caspase family protein [Candidatus Electrothrix sp. AR1]